MWSPLKPEAQKVMRIMKKTLYEVICANREERKKNKKKIKAWMNYIRVFLNSESEIELENKEDLMNTVTEVYAACINAAQNEKRAAGQSFTKKLIQNKYYWITKTVTKKEKNYFTIKR